MRRAHPVSLVVLAAFSVQFGNAFARSYFAEVGPFGAAALRLGFAAVILLVAVRPNIRGWDRTTWTWVIALGIGLGGMNTFIYLAFQHVDMGIAVTVELAGPIAVAIAGTRRWKDVTWIVLAVLGILLIARAPGTAVSPLGIGFALCSATMWALYIMASAKAGPHVKGIDGLAIAMTIAALGVMPFGVLQGADAIMANPWLALSFALIALFTSVIPYGCEFIALKHVSPRVFGILSALGPVIAALAGFVVLHEGLHLVQILAMALVIGASIGVIVTAPGARKP